MKKTLLKNMALIMMLCVSTMSFAAINWSLYDYVEGSDNKYKVEIVEGLTVVNVQQPGWATERGIYCHVPAGISSCSVGSTIDGAGVLLHLSSFTAKETPVEIVYATGIANFTVYYEDGVENGDVENPTPETTQVLVSFADGIGTFKYEGTVVDGYTGQKYDENKTTPTNTITFPNSYYSNGAATNYVTIVPTEGGFKAGDVVTLSAYYNNDEEKNGVKHARLAFYNPESEQIFMSELFVNGKVEAGVPPTQTFTLAADAEYLRIGRANPSGENATRVNLLTLEVTRVAAGEEPSEPALTAPDKAAPTPEWPEAQVKAIYSPTYGADCNFGEWNSGTQYSQDTYGKKYVVGTNGNGYFGMEFEGLNCINMEKLHFDIWIATDATIRVVPIWGGAEYGVTVSLKGQQWNSIDIDKTDGDFANITDWSNVYQIKIDNAPNLTFWIGNAYFYRAEAMEDNEAPTAVSAVVDATSYYSIDIKVNATDNSEAVNFTVYNEQDVVATKSGASKEDIIITVSNLTPGTQYTFSVVASDDNNNKAEAVTVSATTLAAPDAAPVPTVDAANVKSLYSDTYTPAVAVTNYCEWWWNSPSLSVVVLGDDNNTLYYKVTDPVGSFGWVLAALDAKGYQKLHVSIYPEQEGTITIRPVFDNESAELRTTETLTAGEWNEVVLDYTDLSFETTFTQIGFLNLGSLGSFFIDNVYFFKEGNNDTPTGLNTVDTDVRVQKFIENGQLIILRDGIRYNAVGRMLGK